jgi:hypothetical protein
MKRWLFPLLIVAAAIATPCVYLVWAVQDVGPPPRPPKTEHQLQPDISPCFEFDGDAFVDCVTRRV